MIPPTNGTSPMMPMPNWPSQRSSTVPIGIGPGVSRSRTRNPTMSFPGVACFHMRKPTW